MLFPYKSTDSRIHRLDARPKVAFVLAIFVFSILVSDIAYLVVLLAFVLATAAAAKVLRSTLGLLRYAGYVAVFVILFNILISSGQEVIAAIGPITLTTESLLFAISMSLRLFLAVSAFGVLTFAIHPDEAMRVVSKVGYRTTTGLSLSTRMYPTIAADTQNITDSMRARGVEFDRGGFLAKIRSRSHVVMPLLLNSLERSVAVAEAMEARGFGSSKRTNYSERRMSRSEKLMTAMFIAAAVLGIALFILGYGNADYLRGVGLDWSLGDVLVISIYVILLSPIVVGGRR
ncbi:MAG: energy-coupling factor transporter transmembrane protein EcfT [Euryarchaeota archaeon]|nr:energy-coupling factor transporter transmembrane protein EcfT [Euryarchaeota archaeon]